MAIEDKERIIIPDENGQEHLFEVVFTFDVENTGKSYVVVSPMGGDEQNQDEEDEMEVFAFRYEEKEEDDDDLALYQIETDEEWDIVEEMINTVSAELEEEGE
ncbi:DUF1292 domain-containing protein [Bacillus marinisedimentorum]|uniref:DUF1292 domain-containing protein n=1 Tax=Bacillus marinisedimentorum TaxID=1821260 RepID=UPI0007E0EDA6|nr:DUF1292 domain-containing protein [Bacillus marinisedimentorum]